ncbi:unnamed protein product [Trichobilharzia regenti]|nr:unnamed protein product [Trichobilharzia regenti]
MMAKMGYREGQGLGRESQGMSTALVVEKTSRRGGKIIHEKDQQRQQQTNPPTGNNNSNLPNYLNPNVEETFNSLPLPEHRSCVSNPCLFVCFNVKIYFYYYFPGFRREHRASTSHLHFILFSTDLFSWVHDCP